MFQERISARIIFRSFEICKGYTTAKSYLSHVFKSNARVRNLANTSETLLRLCINQLVSYKNCRFHLNFKFYPISCMQNELKDIVHPRILPKFFLCYLFFIFMFNSYISLQYINQKNDECLIKESSNIIRRKYVVIVDIFAVQIK